MVKVLLPVGNGINSDYELQHAFEKAGAEVNRVLLKKIKPEMIEDYQIIGFAGGFAHGDALGAGTVFANKLRFDLGDTLRPLLEDGKILGIGICNGNQILTKTGYIPADQGYGIRTMTLTDNECGSFVNKWTTIKSISKKCVWTKDLGVMPITVRHGEGMYYSRDETLYQKLFDNDQVALIYVKPDGSPAQAEPPFNPNGSPFDIAGICDPTGHILGIMPHPECFTDLRQYPHWTRYVTEQIRIGRTIDDIDWQGPGLKIFQQGIDYAEECL